MHYFSSDITYSFILGWWTILQEEKFNTSDILPISKIIEKNVSTWNTHKNYIISKLTGDRGLGRLTGHESADGIGCFAEAAFAAFIKLLRSVVPNILWDTGERALIWEEGFDGAIGDAGEKGMSVLSRPSWRPIGERFSCVSHRILHRKRQLLSCVKILKSWEKEGWKQFCE